MRLRNLFLVSLVLPLLVNCAEPIKITNTKVVSVAGQISDGAIWAETLTDKTGELDLKGLIEFLEAQPEKDGKPARAAAICQSAEDWNVIKTALDQTCRKTPCSHEVRETLRLAGRAIRGLQVKTLKLVKP